MHLFPIFGEINQKNNSSLCVSAVLVTSWAINLRVNSRVMSFTTRILSLFSFFFLFGYIGVYAKLPLTAIGQYHLVLSFSFHLCFHSFFVLFFDWFIFFTGSFALFFALFFILIAPPALSSCPAPLIRFAFRILDLSEMRRLNPDYDVRTQWLLLR